jgi:hypothetical protein
VELRSSIEVSSRCFNALTAQECPLCQGCYGYENIAPQLRQFVVDPWGDSWSDFSGDISVTLQTSDRSRQYLLRDRSDTALEFGEAHASTRQHRNRQDGPLVAHTCENLADRLTNFSGQIAESGCAFLLNGNLEVTRFLQSAFLCGDPLTHSISVSLGNQEGGL